MFRPASANRHPLGSPAFFSLPGGGGPRGQRRGVRNVPVFFLATARLSPRGTPPDPPPPPRQRRGRRRRRLPVLDFPHGPPGPHRPVGGSPPGGRREVRVLRSLTCRIPTWLNETDLPLADLPPSQPQCPPYQTFNHPVYRILPSPPFFPPPRLPCHPLPSLPSPFLFPTLPSPLFLSPTQP